MTIKGANSSQLFALLQIKQHELYIHLALINSVKVQDPWLMQVNVCSGVKFVETKNFKQKRIYHIILLNNSVHSSC